MIDNYCGDLKEDSKIQDVRQGLLNSMVCR